MVVDGVRFLVPASERKHEGGTRFLAFRDAQDERFANRFPSLAKPRREVIAAFQHAQNGAGHGARVLGLAAEALEEACRHNLAMDSSPTLPVLEREAGPLFQALCEPPLSGAAARRLRDDVVVVCPLLGLLGTRDLVPLYRCPIGAQIPGFGSVHEFWKARVTPLLNRLCRHRRVFSFLPGRLLAQWAGPHAAAGLVTFRFERRGEGGLVHPDSAAAGALSGQILRHLLETGASDPAQLAGFRSRLGHRLHATVEADGATCLVFRR
jgi:cytoplasmic iron level regulating protein YaaA (DUF328/UPF0246 family)